MGDNVKAVRNEAKDILSEMQRLTIEGLASEALENTKNSMDKMWRAVESLFRVILPKRDLKITILFHSDLDGNGSAFCIAEMLDRIYSEYKEDGGNVMYYELRRINYNYDIEKFADISDSDAIFVVDYSLSVKEHIEFLTEKTIGDIYWIDHHQGSYDNIINNPDDHVAHKFMSMNRLFNVFYTKKGISGTLLCYNFARYCWNKMITAKSDSPCEGFLYEPVPAIIALTSFYDTFHPLSSKEFYYGINTVAYDVQEGNIPVWRDALVNTRVDKAGEYDTGCLCLDHTRYFTNAHSGRKTMYDIMKDGNLILQYAVQENKKNVSAQMIELDLIFKGEHYSVAAINKMTNSFVFGDEYDKHDGVIVFYFNRYGTYTYSFFANESGEHRLPCLEIATALGGGGHKFAAGATIKVNLLEACALNRELNFDEILKK